MEICTILPTAHLGLESESQFHLCLAHQMIQDQKYRAFFLKMSSEGKWATMDNGSAEGHAPMHIDSLLDLAGEIKCSEIVLPDHLFDRKATLAHSRGAMLWYQANYKEGFPQLLAVPHGDTPQEWVKCVEEMVTWEAVKCIGISRFLVPRIFQNRVEALHKVPMLIDSTKEIHILGCPGSPAEISRIDSLFPGRIRSVDSGIAAIYTQAGRKLTMGSPKPNEVIDLNRGYLDDTLLKENIHQWKTMVRST
jgi:hypothetical protein